MGPSGFRLCGFLAVRGSARLLLSKRHTYFGDPQ